MNNIFISFKCHDEDGNLTPDYKVAKHLYETLTMQGYDVFFSEESILSLGNADYLELIDDALNKANILILVSSCPENCLKQWVRYEWESFYLDILNGKAKGMFLSYVKGNINDYPRKIRTRQSFAWDDPEGETKLLKLLRGFSDSQSTSHAVPFSLGEKQERKGGSSYNYDVGDEKHRLEIQAKLESPFDEAILQKVIGELTAAGACRILDVGCSTGLLTQHLFAKYGDKVSVLGIDKFQSCVVEFNERFSSMENFQAEELDFDQEDWEQKLKGIMWERSIPRFDLIFCSMSLHHMAESGAVLKGLRNLLREGGYIYVRTNDDGLKIAYPDPDGNVENVIRATLEIPGISDRLHGRKIYSELLSAGYSEISVQHYNIDTANKSMDEREAIFENTFSWRKNYFCRQVRAAKNTGDLEKINTSVHSFNKVVEEVDRIEALFGDPRFYFSFFVTTALARK